MPSPFPGFDPFLEAAAFWPDFHSTFINYWREAIADALPDEYEASLGERVYLVELDFLRGGKRVPLAGRYPPGDAFYLVSRGDRRPECQVYAWQLSRPLPTLPVPLRSAGRGPARGSGSRVQHRVRTRAIRTTHRLPIHVARIIHRGRAAMGATSR